MKIKKALICGVSGQDGTYLSKLLLEKGYQVYGGSRDAKVQILKILKILIFLKKLNLFQFQLMTLEVFFR